jgi:hypothetical protein
MAHWMQGVAEKSKAEGKKGVFKRAAERAGKSTHEFAEEHKHSKGKIGRRARLALAYMGSQH